MEINRIASFFPKGSPNEHDQSQRSQPATALEERQQLLAHHVRLVARRLTNGVCVYSARGGLGKTKVVLETLRSEGVRPVVLNGHCTPLSLYHNLFRNQDRIIFLDDCDAMFRSLPTLGILRSALWGDASDGRLVTYNSSQLEIPSYFAFTGAIIFAVNMIPHKNPAFQACLSRVDQFELDATNAEVIEMMRHLARQGFDGKLNPAECMEVVDFIADVGSSQDLSLRLLVPSYRKMIYALEVGCDWKDLVRTQLERIGKENAAKPLDSRSYNLDCVRQAMQQHPNSVTAQVEFFCKITGKSRASFFRFKRML